MQISRICGRKGTDFLWIVQHFSSLSSCGYKKKVVLLFILNPKNHEK